MEQPLEREERVVNPEHAQAVRDMDSAFDQAWNNPALQGLIQRCLTGEEPQDDIDPGVYTPDGAYQGDKFNMTHVQIVMLRAAGFRNKDVAQMLGVTSPMVYYTLRHPYARKILGLLVPMHAVKVIDIRTRMEHYASELVDHAYDLAKESKDVAEVSRVTFGFLDRAGFAPRTQPASPEGAAAAPDSLPKNDRLLARIAAAVEESVIVDRQVMPSYSPARPPEDGLVAESGSSVEAPLPRSGGSNSSITGGSQSTAEGVA